MVCTITCSLSAAVGKTVLHPRCKDASNNAHSKDVVQDMSSAALMHTGVVTGSRVHAGQQAWQQHNIYCLPSWPLRLWLVASVFLSVQVCNNLVLGVSMAAVAEGLALGSKLGLDPKLLSDIFNSSSARCWSSDSYNPCPACAQ